MTIQTTIEHYLNLFKAHERLLLLLAAGFFAVHFYGKGIDYLTKRDQTQAQIAAANAKQSEQLLTQQQQQFSAQLASISAQIAVRDKQNVTQKQVDNKMSTSELAARIAQLVQVHPQDVTQATLPDHLDLDSTATQAVTSALEDDATCKLDLKDTQTLLQQSQTLTQTTQNALDAEKKSHDADVKELKSKNRTSWLHGFKWGVIVGVAGSEAARIALIHKP